MSIQDPKQEKQLVQFTLIGLIALIVSTLYLFFSQADVIISQTVAAVR